MGSRRVDLKEAAEILGTTTEAVRKRAKRGTLDSETGDDGLLYVWVDDSADRVDDRVDTQVDGRVDERLIERMASEIEFLRGELQRKDTILMTMAQRIPELEPAKEPSPEPRESPETASVGAEGVEVPFEEKQRSWWRRFFGL